MLAIGEHSVRKVRSSAINALSLGEYSLSSLRKEGLKDQQSSNDTSIILEDENVQVEVNQLLRECTLKHKS